MRKLASGILLLTSVSVALGALGHGLEWSHALPALRTLEPHLLAVLRLVWFWVSGAMLSLGVLLVWAWWRLRRGDTRAAVVPWVSGLFYLLAGVYGATYVGAFFLIFAVQAVLLFSTTWVLQRPALTPAA
jgi:hypothetical protein